MSEHVNVMAIGIFWQIGIVLHIELKQIQYCFVLRLDYLRFGTWTLHLL